VYRYQELIASKDEYSSLPLIVNTDGWVKGLGYEILSAVVGTCKPAHIVQILGNTKAKSFDMTSFHSRNGGDNTHPGTTVHTIQSFDDFSNPILEDGSKRGSLDSQSVVTGTLLATASDHRSHRICAYFLGGCGSMSRLKSGITGDNTPIQFHREKGLVDPSNVIGLTLASMLPYAVPFRAVKLYPPSGLLDSLTELGQMWGLRADMASSDVLESLSGAIVALCYEPDASDLPSVVNCNAGCGVPVLPCAGLGIIRSTDTIRRLFYVLTPIHPQLLPRVTSFVGGNIGLPFECVYRGIYSDSFPYMSFGQAAANPGLGSEVMKSRNHSGRKK
jgi:polynucleotide 5'-hydroxyl-kinase GRC3/NOL9